MVTQILPLCLPPQGKTKEVKPQSLINEWKYESVWVCIECEHHNTQSRMWIQQFKTQQLSHGTWKTNGILYAILFAPKAEWKYIFYVKLKLKHTILQQLTCFTGKWCNLASVSISLQVYVLWSGWKYVWFEKLDVMIIWWKKEE